MLDMLRHGSRAKEDMGLLAVMEAIEDKSRISQRELARVTGLNLKKVNYCLHKLLEKGYVKFQKVRHNPDKRAYLYILTPAGFKAKSQLTYGFLKYTLDFYSQIEDRLRQCLDRASEAGMNRVALFGQNDIARIILGLDDLQAEIVGVLRDGPGPIDFHGIPAKSLDCADQMVWDCVLITDPDATDEAEARLLAEGIPPDKIWRLA
ncbi:TPA: hypothetical protein DCE37_12615 [Candidatus Latescibacteria bacterium]|nr:hypothetical protein [Candidatus Latescibacterota bacterium]